MASKKLREIIKRFQDEFTGDFEVDELPIWLGRIREALLDEYGSDDEIWALAARLLNARYKRGIRDTKKRHKFKVHRFGPESISEKYRPYLAQRIRASAELIKLNRDTEIEAQIKRFAGWATGGLPEQTKRPDTGELAKGVNKSLRSMSFEKRRVCIDQGHKMIAAIDDVIAQEHGAIAKVWRHIVPHPGYQSRKEHLERDGKVYAVRDNPLLKAGKMKVGRNGYAEDIEDPPSFLPFCSCKWQAVYYPEDLPDDMRSE